MPERIAVWIGTKASLVVHSLIFTGAFSVGAFHVLPWDTVLLILTTAVSLEAIYLAIFIQMTMNAQASSLKEVEVDIDEIQKDVDEIQEDVDEIQEDIEEIEEDVDEIPDETQQQSQQKMLSEMSENLQRLLVDVEKMKKEIKS